MTEPEIPLPGGGVGGAIRVGATVRRPTGPWTPTVHTLLGHLRAAGLAGVPEPLGYDDAGREVLSYLDGECAEFFDPWPDWAYGDELIDAALGWLADFHRASASFRAAGDARWRSGVRAIDHAAGEIVCHNDFAPYNLIVAHDPLRLVGVIDWDVAGPGQPMDDLAFFAYNTVPLFEPDRVAAAEVARKLRRMVWAYGRFDAGELLDAVIPRQERALRTIEAGAAAGDQGLRNLVDRGDVDFHRAALAGLRRRLPELHAALATDS